ncbi:MAG: hypothetical protein IIA49_08620, partial [Bacteroidetes bacterium]|nr:hypothetical protein [Bacteroidota bacterium]
RRRGRSVGGAGCGALRQAQDGGPGQGEKHQACFSDWIMGACALAR